MNIRRIIIPTALILTLLAPMSVHALDAATQQHITELQAQIDALEKEAQGYRNGIAAQQDKAASLNRDIAILQGQIAAAQAEVNATGKKIDLTTTQISQTEGQLAQTQGSIDQQSGSIGRLVFFLDQYDHEDIVASLFKYKDLSSFLQQFHDVAQVQDQLVDIVNNLKDQRATLQDTKLTLQQQQDQLQKLKDDAAQKQQQLAGVKGEKSKLLTQTKGQEALYQKQLTATEKKQAAFFKEQQGLEAQVIAGGLFIVHVTASVLPAKGSHYFSLPEDHPRITQGYGMTAYAKRGAYGGQPHSGIDYASGYGTPIKAIGDGTLIAHGTNDGWGNWIAIQHTNNMVSLYGHMSRFAPLAVGTVLTRGQVIGYEGDTGNVTGSHVHLSLYRDFFTYVKDTNGQLYFNYFDGTVNPLDYL